MDHNNSRYYIRVIHYLSFLKLKATFTLKRTNIYKIKSKSFLRAMYHLQNIFLISLKREPNRTLTSGPVWIVRKLSTAVKVPRGVRDGKGQIKSNLHCSTRTRNKLSIQVGIFLLSLQLKKKMRKSAQTTILLHYYPQIKAVKARRTPGKKTLA